MDERYTRKKDGIKERMFDRLGWSDRDWSRKLGLLTYDVLFYVTESLLAGGISFVLESNFHSVFHTPIFRSLKERYPFEPYQVFCFSDPQILMQRFRQRMDAGGRHPGHTDALYIDEFHITLVQGPGSPLDIGGQVVKLDTAEFERINYAELFEGIARQCL